MNAYRKDEDKSNSRIGFMQFLWLTVATVAGTYAVYLDLLVIGSGNSPFL
jgi:hypothetical protein